MTRRLFMAAVVSLMLLHAARGQFPGQNIPPTRVPETEEPGRADPMKAGEIPEKLKGSVVGPVAPLAPGAAPVVPADPPPPVVTIHVAAPASTSAGADVEYKITVENKSQAAAHRVRVTNPIPDGVEYLGDRSDPTPNATAKLLTWELGTLKPGESKTMRFSFRPSKEGLEAIENTARVHFEHGQKVRTVLHRPKIALRKITHQHALQNQAIKCRLVVENTGVVDLTNIVVEETPLDGLEFVEKGPPPGGWRIAALKPKEKHELQYTMKAAKTGTLETRLSAKAERGAVATEQWQIRVGPSPLTVTMTGPPKVYLNYPATYQIQVNYADGPPLDNVIVTFSLAKGMKVVRATPGAQDFKDGLQWAIPRLNPRETRSLMVSVQTASAGTVPSAARVLWRGPEQRAEVTTEFLGAVALQLDVREERDPVRVGEKVKYTMTVTNRGSAAAKDVRLVVGFGVTNFAIDVDGSDGKLARNGVQEIVLDSIPPKGTVTKTITLKATAAGKAIVDVEMAAPDLPAGNVTRQEHTTVTE